MHIITPSEAAMTGPVDRRRTGRLPAAIAVAAIALTLTALLAAGLALAAATPPTWPAHPQTIRPIAAAGPPTWPTHPQPIQPATAATATARDGFDWGSAGIGAGVGALLAVICGVAVLVPTTRRARRARAA